MSSLETTIELSSGYRMPLLGLGMWQTDQADAVEVAVEAAVEAGYRHIDTAFAYGNEAHIGRCLRRLLQGGRVDRGDLFVVTKLPLNGMRPDDVEHFFRKSLSSLQLDYIDLYLIHLPIAVKRTEKDEEVFPLREDGDLDTDIVDHLDTWRAMESLVDKGLTKSIGLSNFNSEQVKRIYDSARIKPAVLQVECHAYLPQSELLAFCRSLDIALTAYSPLGSPGLPEFAKKRYDVNFNAEVLLHDERLKPIAEKHVKTPAQILLRYLVQRGIVVIPKSSNPERIRENIQIFDSSLDETDMKTLRSMGRNFRYFTFDFHKSMKSHPDYPFNIPF